MKFKTINRDWVKNAAIIFLAVLLVLTFFSNTIMNRSLPEVATQMVQDGSITAKVRGTGMVTANGLHEVKATQTREIRAVMIKSGQEVEAGDVLFVLGAGDSAELEAAQEQLRQLQSRYNSTAVSNPGFDWITYNAKLTAANEEKAKADSAVSDAQKKFDENVANDSNPQLKAAQERLDAAIVVRDELSDKYNETIGTRTLSEAPATELITNNTDGSQIINVDINTLSVLLKEKVTLRETAKSELDAAKGELTVAQAELAAAEAEITTPPGTTEQQTAVTNANSRVDAAKLVINGDGINAGKQKAYDDAVAAVKVQALADLTDKTTAKELDDAQAEVDKRTAEVEHLSAGNEYAQALAKAKEKQLAAIEKISAVQEEKASFDRANASVGVTLTDLAVQINQQKEKIKELSGEEADQIVANVAGTVESVNCTAGDTKPKDEVLCTIEVPDMGYTLSFSVTNDQAKRLRTGNTATVSNYYWGSEILAKLTNIKTDPKNPQSNKLLTFDLTGDVTAGAELTLSVGEKSANYDIIIPNSAIRSDTNGSFVLMIVAKNSPLGNRYIAQRVGIEVVAADDSNSAVTAGLTYGDYVITTSNAPIKSGDQVRMADG